MLYTPYEFFYDDSFKDYAPLYAIDKTFGTYTVRAEWNPDAALALADFHSIDAEAELEKMLVYELQKSIHQEELERFLANYLIE